MVRGIERFKEFFSEYTGRYVIIGGTACDIILGNEGSEFRATKDLDIVLLLESLDNNFINRFVEFIKKGGYQHKDRSSGKDQFYRFREPDDPSFPSMIELFCRRPEYMKDISSQLAPIHISDEVISLSAILLDDDYYQLLQQGSIEVNGVSVLGLEYLILFKIKAWIDLSERKQKGEQIDSKNVKKHKNDVLRLTANLNPEIHLTVNDDIRNNIRLFLSEAIANPVDIKKWQIRRLLYNDLIERIKSCYEI